VEVKIGIKSVARELVVETPASADEVARQLAAALADGQVFELHDDKGGRVLVPADKLAYVQLSANETRRVGFSTA
jgi:DNA-binding transcriptional regulator/RsmH inhibitor MraZ